MTIRRSPNRSPNRTPNMQSKSRVGSGGGSTTGKAANFGSSGIGKVDLNYSISNSSPNREYAVACSILVPVGKDSGEYEYVWAIVDDSTTNKMMRFRVLHQAGSVFRIGCSYTNSTTVHYLSTTDLNIGTEYRIIWQEENDSTDRNLYINGSLDINFSSSRALPTMDTFSIGGTADTTPQYSSNLTVWDVAVYSKALSTTDIANDFNTPTQLPYLAGDATVTSGDLEGHWPCNEASGNFIDYSTHSLDLVASGTINYEQVVNSFITQPRAVS